METEYRRLALVIPLCFLEHRCPKQNRLKVGNIPC